MTRPVRILLADTDDSPYPSFLSKCANAVNLLSCDTPAVAVAHLDSSDHLPDIVIVNLLLAERTPFRYNYLTYIELDGLEVLRTCVERYPSIPFVAVAHYPHVQTVMKAYEAGAFWFVSRNGRVPSDFVERVVKRSDRTPLAPHGVGEQTLNMWLAKSDPHLGRCTERDIEMLRAVMLGLESSETSELLGMASPESLRTSIARAVYRSGLMSRDELISHARSIGITPSPN